MNEPVRLPLFPLKTVLLPGGVLPLRVFEPRYMDMVTHCMRESTSFGVCLIAAGEEVGEAAVPHPVGTEARIEQWDMAQAGVLNLLARGGARFRIEDHEVERDGLLVASVRWLEEPPAQPVPDAFHARYSARARRYVYRLLNRPIRPALNRQYLSWEPRPLDASAMDRAAQALLGEQDFSAFRAQACQANHARRNLHAIQVRREPGQIVAVEVQANAFLHHMIRNIVGSLLLVGRGERPEAWIGEVLAGRRRELAGPTAPAAGLTFLGPMYPASWGLPEEATLPPAWETGE